MIMLSVSEPRIRASHARCVAEGIDHLGDDQLLELLVTPFRQRAEALSSLRSVLDQHDGVLGIAALSPAALIGLGLRPGIASIVATAFELGRRVAGAKRRARPSCKTPEQVAELMAPQLVALPAEELWVLPLDSKSQLIGDARMVSRGDVDGTDAGPRAVMRIALTAGATSCVIVHQHPGGDPEPSAADRSATARIAAAGRLVDVPLVDHVVLGASRFVSLHRVDPTLFR